MGTGIEATSRRERIVNIGVVENNAIRPTVDAELDCFWLRVLSANARDGIGR